jgi:hypothetical protein
MCDDVHDRYKYDMHDGDDPLQYQSIIEKLNANKSIDRDGYASSDAWFKATVDHDYPNALYRVCGAFNEIAEFRAQVIFTMKNDYMFGPWKLDFGSRLFFGGIKGNHGGLRNLESSAFVATTNKDIILPPVMSYEHALITAIFGSDRTKWPLKPSTPPMRGSTPVDLTKNKE